MEYVAVAVPLNAHASIVQIYILPGYIQSYTAQSLHAALVVWQNM